MSEAWFSSSTWKTGGDVGLEREHVQQTLAQGVQGLDLEAARRFDGTGEQAPRHFQQTAGGRFAGQFGEFGRQGGIVEGDPAPEGAEHPDRHVRGGRLGEGETQDACRRRAVQQESHDAVGENLGLSRPRIGGDPGRGQGIGGAALARLGEIVDDEGQPVCSGLGSVSS